MANGPWNGSVNDSVTGLAVGNARITVTDPATGDLVGLYDDRDGTLPKGNPFLTPPDGKVQFFARAGRVNIAARYAGRADVFENEIILDEWGAGCACGVATPIIISMLSNDNTESINPSLSAGQALVFFGLTQNGLPAGLNLRLDFGAGFAPIFHQTYLPNNEFSPNDTGCYFFVGAIPLGYGGYDTASTLTLMTDDEAFATLTMDNITSWIVEGLRETSDVDCLFESVSINAEEGAFDTGVMTAQCNSSFIIYRIVSPGAGMTTPSNNTGFTSEDTDSVSGFPAYWGYGIAGDTSKQVTISVGSGAIYGAMIILRTALTEPPPPTGPEPSVIAFVEYLDGAVFSITLDEGFRADLTNFLTQYNIEGGGWEDVDTIAADTTSYTFPINVGLFETVDFRVLSVNGEGSTPSNVVTLP